jgi:hypothetical protein
MAQASALPMLLLFAFGQRYFMAGVATQGRKGRMPNRCYIPATRRAASSICAAPRTRTIAATVDVSFAGSVTVGCVGHLINIAVGVSGRSTSSTAI